MLSKLTVLCLGSPTEQALHINMYAAHVPVPASCDQPFMSGDQAYGLPGNDAEPWLTHTSLVMLQEILATHLGPMPSGGRRGFQDPVTTAQEGHTGPGAAIMGKGGSAAAAGDRTAAGGAAGGNAEAGAADGEAADDGKANKSKSRAAKVRLLAAGPHICVLTSPVL